MSLLYCQRMKSLHPSAPTAEVTTKTKQQFLVSRSRCDSPSQAGQDHVGIPPELEQIEPVLLQGRAAADTGFHRIDRLQEQIEVGLVESLNDVLDR